MVLNRKKVDFALQGSEEFLLQVEKLKYSRVLFTSEGQTKCDIDETNNQSAETFAVSVCCDAERTESKDTALDLPVDLCNHNHLRS